MKRTLALPLNGGRAMLTMERPLVLAFAAAVAAVATLVSVNRMMCAAYRDISDITEAAKLATSSAVMLIEDARCLVAAIDEEIAAVDEEIKATAVSMRQTLDQGRSALCSVTDLSVEVQKTSHSVHGLVDTIEMKPLRRGVYRIRNFFSRSNLFSRGWGLC